MKHWNWEIENNQFSVPLLCQKLTFIEAIFQNLHLLLEVLFWFFFNDCCHHTSVWVVVGCCLTWHHKNMGRVQLLRENNSLHMQYEIWNFLVITASQNSVSLWISAISKRNEIIRVSLDNSKSLLSMAVWVEEIWRKKHPQRCISMVIWQINDT